jgi:hypothetical protein
MTNDILVNMNCVNKEWTYRERESKRFSLFLWPVPQYHPSVKVHYKLPWIIPCSDPTPSDFTPWRTLMRAHLITIFKRQWAGNTARTDVPERQMIPHGLVTEATCIHGIRLILIGWLRQCGWLQYSYIIVLIFFLLRSINATSVLKKWKWNN